MIIFFEREMNLEEKKEFLVKRLDELKISDIKVLDVRKKSSIADYIIIGSGTSDRQIESAIGYIRSDLKKFTKSVLKEEKSEGWISLDLFDIIIHLFTEEQRSIYRLEEIWK